MDITEFINSKDIREHCRKIGHKFTAVEAAYLIYQSHTHTLVQKFAAWESIIAEYPDEELIQKHRNNVSQSLHGFLKEYMALTNRLLDDFFSNEGRSVYSFAINYVSHSSDPLFDDKADELEREVFFADFNVGLSDETENIYEYLYSSDEFLFFTVKKDDIISSAEQTRKRMTVRVSIDGEPLAVQYWENDHITEDEYDILHRFDDMWIEVPTPFKKGDLVITNRTRLGENYRPFVLTALCTEFRSEKSKKYADSSDMTAYGYRIKDDYGHIWYDCDHDYLSLEYYRKPLLDAESTLAAISSYINGEIGLSELMTAYHSSIERFELESYGDKEEYLLHKAGVFDDE